MLANTVICKNPASIFVCISAVKIKQGTPKLIDRRVTNCTRYSNPSFTHKNPIAARMKTGATTSETEKRRDISKSLFCEQNPATCQISRCLAYAEYPKVSMTLLFEGLRLLRFHSPLPMRYPVDRQNKLCTQPLAIQHG